MRARVAAMLVFVPLCAGCSSSALNTTAPTTTAGTGTETFASFLAIGGSSVHTFPVTQAGTIAVTLTVVTPAGVVGLGVGVPNASGPGCNITNSLDASAAVADATTGATTPQLTIPAVVGTYCAKVYDSGQLGSIGRTFTVTIAHP
jgi:hypothetical protein